jgi:hypothetical protein
LDVSQLLPQPVFDVQGVLPPDFRWDGIEVRGMIRYGRSDRKRNGRSEEAPRLPAGASESVVALASYDAGLGKWIWLPQDQLHQFAHVSGDHWTADYDVTGRWIEYSRTDGPPLPLHESPVLPIRVATDTWTWVVEASGGDGLPYPLYWSQVPRGEGSTYFLLRGGERVEVNGIEADVGGWEWNQRARNLLVWDGGALLRSLIPTHKAPASVSLSAQERVIYGLEKTPPPAVRVEVSPSSRTVTWRINLDRVLVYYHGPNEDWRRLSLAEYLTLTSAHQEYLTRVEAMASR